ncbi:MAG: efflux RND transporter periplasmic adaptor subunit [Gammaproteobacteria bacterium]|nr:efflux RND transporter periplasmic adaptor subunit [Gammaproteobacteria bacterium]
MADALLRATVFSVSAALLAACPETPPPPSDAGATGAVDLATAVVQAARVPRETAFDGVIEAINRSTVAAQTSGRVVELPFDVGDPVERGAVIVRLTSTAQSARVEAVEGALAEAEARLAEARLAYNRARDVYQKKLIAKAQLDAAAADFESAQARRETAQAAVAEAREGLGYTVVRAPYSGIVAVRHVQIGETVGPGALLMSGLSLQQLRAVVEIPQQHINPLREHRTARVVLPGPRSVAATALRIPPSADPTTHTFRVRVDLPEGVPGVFPGMLVKVAFVSGEDERLLVPAGAVVRRGEVTGVYVVEESGRVSLRYVRTGTPFDDRVPVLAGLEAGDRVATDPIAAGIVYKNQTRPQDAA